MGNSAGSIQLDLEINRQGFDKQLNNISSLAKKAGMIIAAAFSVKALVDFSKSCIDLGSDLAEVQNVVDVSFPAMSAEVDKFAASAAASFGLSETMAKKFVGTTGAMAKAFGFSEKAAYDMGTAVAGLAGDVASFYNLSHDEAYTKLKSIFTGETESLKDLGVVMTQSALDAYALANGFGKTTNAMSEQEKVALRYKFVMSQLSGASGDFLRTSDGWANQVRVLQLQFESLKATIGQGLISVLLPVIRAINTVIGRVLTMANAFKSFFAMLGGKSSGGGGVSAAASGMEKMTEATGGAGKALKGAGGAAKQAAKEMKNATTGIDELNIISQDGGSGGSGGGSGGGGADAGGYSAEDFDMGSLETSEEKISSLGDRFKSIIEYGKELSGIFAKGFWDGFGDTAVFERIQEHVIGISKSLKEIFTDEDVKNAADKFIKSYVLALGTVAGSVASIGATIAENLLGGADKYLSGNKEYLKDKLVEILDIRSRGAKIIANFSEAVADIFKVFRSEDAKSITEDLIDIFATANLEVITFSEKIMVDIADVFSKPIMDNKSGIKDFALGLLKDISPVIDTIKDNVEHFFGELQKTYEEYGKPFFDAIGSGFSDILGTFLSVYESNIKPVVEDMGEKFKELSETHIRPLISQFMEFAGKVLESFTSLWKDTLVPFINWFITTFGPVFAPILQGIVDSFANVAKGITGYTSGIIEILTGVINFIVGVFTGDWGTAWEGIKQIFSGVWTAMSAVVSTIFGAIGIFIRSNLDAILGFWGTSWDEIMQKLAAVWESIKQTVSVAFEAVKATISTVFNLIKAVWKGDWDTVKSTVSTVWETIKSSVSTAINSVKTSIDTVLGNIKTAWSTAWNGIKDTTQTIWDGIWGVIRGTINTILGGIESMINGAMSGINSLIEGINDVAGSIPGVSETTIPSIPKAKLPRLAQGGYVRANTPQLAMIGDNKYQGEVVAPESKMIEMARIAAELAKSADNSGGSAMIVELLQKILDYLEGVEPTINLDVRALTQKQNDIKRRMGFNMT